MKKIFSLVLVLALTLALGIPALAADAEETAVPEITLSASAEKVPAGKTVTLTLSLTGELKDINSFEYYIKYNPAVVELTESKAAGDLTKIGTPPEANYKTGEEDTSKAVTVSSVKLTDTGVFSMSEGAVAELTFTMKAEAETGASAGFTLEKVAVCDSTFVNDAVKVQTGEAPEVTVGTAAVLGDVDGDGEVTNNDAAMVYGNYLGKVKFNENQTAAADVDGDGEVTNNDAAMIYGFYLGKVPKFPAA